MRKNYIIATAGHVDHGKTCLIKALTGKDCDTHPEEKKRGITIHLGFSHLHLSDGVTAGIVDVPGHKDFIETMISGINGVDLVFFIVAANEGVRTQTHEHLQILNCLGVQKGIIIITKCDLVDEDTLFYAAEEIKELVQNTFLAQAPIIETSVSTGKNITLLKSLCLEILTKDLSAPNTFFINQYSRPFRFFPDRFFQVKGLGTVVTGTVLSGSYHCSNPLQTIPSSKELKIRKMEAYGVETQNIVAGQRASLNITNFPFHDFQKGIMLTDQDYAVTSLLDVSLTIFNIPNPFNLWTTVEFFHATNHTQAKIHLINKDHLFPQETCYAQIHLEKALPLCYGDKFIIRNTSGILTLGGGTIMDAFPLHHRRRTEKVRELFQKRDHNSLSLLVETEIEKYIKPITLAKISQNLFMKISENDFAMLSSDYMYTNQWFWKKKNQDQLEAKIITYLKIAHKHNPLENNGKSLEGLISLVNDYPDLVKSLLLKRTLEQMVEKGTLTIRENTYALANHQVVLSSKDHEHIHWIDQVLLNCKAQLPLIDKITLRAKEVGIDEKKVKIILFYLVQKKRIFTYEGDYIHSINVNPLRPKLKNYLIAHPDGITVAEFRDLINGNRKICLVLLNLFEREGWIIRKEDKRYLR